MKENNEKKRKKCDTSIIRKAFMFAYSKLPVERNIYELLRN